MPLNTWDLIKGDDRAEDSISVYIIFCEDTTSEPYYFRSFGIDKKLKISAIPNQKSGKLNLVNTIVKCEEDGLLECVNHTYKLKEGTTENIWCVYDRDLENADFTKIKPEYDISFTTAIDSATAAGLHVAWSNDVFELWILLHFEKMPTGNRLHRQYIYDRLTEIYKTITPRSPELDAITGNPFFDYKQHMKERANFLTFVLPSLKGKEHIAIENAKELEGLYSTAIPYHNCNPCTKVHKLVLELLSFAEAVK